MRPPAPYVDIAQIQSSDEWISLKVKALAVYPVPRHDSMAQQGVFVDRYGDSIEFVVWNKNQEKARYGPIVQGRFYNLENVVTNEYRDQFSINVPWSANVVECNSFHIAGIDPDQKVTQLDDFAED